MSNCLYSVVVAYRIVFSALALYFWSALALAREPIRLDVAYLGVIDCDSVVEWHRNAFLACHSMGDALPIPGDHGRRPDAYVLRVDLTSERLVYAVRLGGSGYSAAFAISADNDGNAYVAGTTHAADFPTTPDAVQPKFAGGKSDAFVAIISADGKVRYSSFLGGSGGDEGAALRRDGKGRVFVGGTTWSEDFPGSMRGAPLSHPRAFLARIDPNGVQKVISVLLGGNGDTWLSGIEVDGEGGVHAAGVTHAADFPVMRPFQDHLNGSSDAFLSRFDANTLQATFSTYFGGSRKDGAWGVAVTAAGDPVIVGFTDSPDLPVGRRSFQGSLRGGKDAFVARFPQRGRAEPLTTYLGGTGDDAAGSECGGCAGAAISADARGIWVVGTAASKDLPASQASEPPRKAGAQYGFVAAFTSSLEKLCFSSYLGEGEEGALEGVSLTHNHHLLASGFSYSTHTQRGIIDNQSGISLRLNGSPVHAVLVESDVHHACP
jgi:hypothetical protein